MRAGCATAMLAAVAAAAGACQFAPNGGQPGGPADAARADTGHHDGAPADRGLDAPSSPVQLVQQAKNVAGGTETLTATFATPPAAGDVLVLVGGEIAGECSSVKDVGSGWTRASGSFAFQNIEIWYSVATGTGTTVTYSDSDNNGEMYMAIS